MSEDLQQFEVVICGAGLAGAMLACQLADLPSIKIALLEAKPISFDFQEQQGLHSYDPRVSALTLASQKMFEDLHLWQKISRKQAYQKMFVWDAEGTGDIEFSAADVRQPCLGNIVENRLLHFQLLEYLKHRKNVSVVDGFAVAAIENTDRNVRITLENNQRLEASLLVGADGANSLVRSSLQFKTKEWNYGQHAIVCTVETEKAHQDTAWQRFLSSGPLAFLPLDGDQDRFCSIVWSIDENVAPLLMAESDNDFLAKLEFAFEGKLGKIKACSKRYCFPLRQRHAVDYVQANVALIADAAHTIHPLAGQGINLGFQDVAVLAEEIHRAIDKNIPLGDLSVLQRYQRRRKPDNLAMMAVMEGFKRLFGAEELPVRLLRNFGMQELNKHSLLKQKIISKAMGL